MMITILFNSGDDWTDSDNYFSSVFEAYSYAVRVVNAEKDIKAFRIFDDGNLVISEII